MTAEAAKKLLDNGIAIIPLLPNMKHNYDTDILTKDYSVRDLIPNGNLGVNLKKSHWYDIDLDSDYAIYFGSLWLPHNTRILGRRYPDGREELTHFFFKSDGSVIKNTNDNSEADFFVDHNVVVHGKTPHKKTQVAMERFWKNTTTPMPFNESILKIYWKVCFASKIAAHSRKANMGALKLDACVMRYTSWTDTEREDFLWDIFSKVAPNERDTSYSKFRRIVKANNNKTKNAGYNSYAQYLGVESEDVKKWFGWIGEVPQYSKYEKIKSYVDFTSTGLDMNKLMTEDIPPLQYAVEPILPEGFACVAGRPKSMKSWTMLDLIFCIQNGLSFWGHKIVQGDCLGIFNEDGKRRLKDRIIKLGHQKLKFPTIALEAPYLGFGLEESIIDWIDSVERPKLVVIDTLARVKPRANKKSGTAYDHDTELLRDIQKLAITKRVTIAVVSHLTKAPQDYSFDRITGSAGMQGVPDTLWMIDKGDNSNSASVMGIGRDIQDFEHSLEWDDAAWRYKNNGDLSEIKKLGTKGEIIEAMKTLEGSGTKDIRPRTVVRHLGYGPQSNMARTIAKTMQRMLEERELGRGDKYGVYVYSPTINK